MTLRFLLCLFLSKAALASSHDVSTDVLTPEKPTFPLPYYGSPFSPLSPEGPIFDGNPVSRQVEILKSDASLEEREIALRTLLDLANNEAFEVVERTRALEWYDHYALNYMYVSEGVPYYKTIMELKSATARIFANIDHKTFERIEDYFSFFKKFDFNTLFPKGLSLVQDSSIPVDDREKFVREYLFGANTFQRTELEAVLLGVARAENSFDFAILLVGTSVVEHVRIAAQKLVTDRIVAETDPDEKEVMKEACRQRYFQINLSSK